MDKLKMHTPNRADENFKKLAALFPNAVTETIDENGEVVRAIDKDVLMQEISCTVVDGNEERYQFTWPDKKKSMLLANAPINKTLRPCREESVDFDNTENLYIEGDNLEVLKLLQETYLGKIKMIYIDPPYNTGNDFVYEDNFDQASEYYKYNSGQFDAEGNRLVKNLDSNGRFHTDWLNMIYPRLKIAKDLLCEDGFIAISIGEEESDNLKKVCDEIFGEANFRNVIEVRRYDKNLNLQFAADGLSTMNVGLEYIYVYSRNPYSKMTAVYKPSTDERASLGYWKGFWNNADRPTMRYDVLGVTPTDGQWKWKKEVADEAVRNYKEYEEKYSSKMTLEEYWNITGRNKRFIRRKAGGSGKNLGVEHWVAPAAGILRNSNWSDMLVSKPAGLGLSFDSPKNPEVIAELIKLFGVASGDVILDFFSGSATTAHAVMELNVEDNKKRKFIMVQIPEETDEKSEAYKAGYKNICEIGKERIRRAAKKIAEENPDSKFDGGFRVLKCDTSNMKDIYYSPFDFNMNLLDMMTDNIKEDRTPEDLLFQVMLDLGIELSSKIEETTIADKKVFDVADGFLIACFDKNVNDETIKAIAQKQPYYFVMRDSSLANDSVATNFEQIFATYSPDTVREGAVMETLTKIEIGTFLKLFNRGGYVLDFSTNDFDIFTMDSIGVALCEKYKMSKGKSLIAYINDASDNDAAKLLKDLLEYYEEHYEWEYNESIDEDFGYFHQYNAENARLYKKCRTYMDRVLNIATPLAANASELVEKFSSEYLAKQIQLMLKMQTENPTDAIGKAKELIESCCKTILDNKKIAWDKNWDMGKLTGETLNLLRLTPKSIPNDDPVSENIKAVLGNLRGITTKLAEIRNPYGSGHGKSASFTGLDVRHAKLAVGCSITFVTFLWDTYEEGR